MKKWKTLSNIILAFKIQFNREEEPQDESLGDTTNDINEESEKPIDIPVEEDISLQAVV